MLFSASASAPACIQICQVYPRNLSQSPHFPLPSATATVQGHHHLSPGFCKSFLKSPGPLRPPQPLAKSCPGPRGSPVHLEGARALYVACRALHDLAQPAPQAPLLLFSSPSHTTFWFLEGASPKSFPTAWLLLTLPLPCTFPILARGQRSIYISISSSAKSSRPAAQTSQVPHVPS